MATTESDIIKAIKKGDAFQFELLFKSYYPLLCAYAHRFIDREEDAEEIVQELFFQLWKKRKFLNIHTSLKAYLYRSTYTGCMDKIRKLKVRKAYYEKQVKAHAEGFEDKAMEADEVNKIIIESLNKLPENVRKVFKMSRFEGLKYREIADQLSISVKTVEANMAKALKFLRNNLQDYVSTILL